MRRIGPSLLLCLLGLVSASLRAESNELRSIQAKALSVSFTPVKFLAGEPARARVVLDVGNARPSPFTLRAGAGLPEAGRTDAVELTTVSLAKEGNNWVLSVAFVAWAPGSGALPSIVEGGLRTPELPFTATPATLVTDREAGPRRPQLDPPGTAFYLYATIGLLVACAALAFAFFSWLLPGARAILRSWREREAFRGLTRTLDWLEENADAPDGSAWYAVLARAFRVYLSRRLIPPAMALTPREFEALDPEGLPSDPFRAEMAALLEATDEARFARRPEKSAERTAAAARARHIARLVEDSGGRAIDVRN